MIFHLRPSETSRTAFGAQPPVQRVWVSPESVLCVIEHVGGGSDIAVSEARALFVGERFEEVMERMKVYPFYQKG